MPAYPSDVKYVWVPSDDGESVAALSEGYSCGSVEVAARVTHGVFLLVLVLVALEDHDPEGSVDKEVDEGAMTLRVHPAMSERNMGLVAGRDAVLTKIVQEAELLTFAWNGVFLPRVLRLRVTEQSDGSREAMASQRTLHGGANE